MKKYQIAAAVLGLTLASCSHDLEYSSITDVVTDTYKTAFVETFGTPAATQNWGFADVATSRLATRAENANANEWADIKNSTGYGGWLVPDPLTEGQKLRVKAYFQANPNLTFEDPHWTNFFVQQVYKGATDAGPNSTEIVTAANGTQYTSSNMNLMTVGQANVHINNFNAGDCSVNNDVLDNGSDILAGKTSYHSDKIMLMVNIDDTSCFGYHETGASKHHNDKAALVAASVIDAWAVNYGGGIGEAVVDKWNRSFLGYDLELLNADDVKSENTMKYNDGPEGVSYIKLNGEFVQVNGSDVVTYNNQPVYYIATNTNQYAATTSRLQDSEILQEVRINGQYYGKALNMDNINAKLADGWLPVKDKNLREWVKVMGGDGYYSDWIVTVTKAERYSDDGEDGGDEEEDNWGTPVRVIAEDLSVTQRTDFDFNDVVFDVCFNEARTKAKITLKAAGGTLPLTVGWSGAAGTNYLDYEVHELYGVPVSTMVNTNAVNGADNQPDVTFILEGTFVNPNDVKVMVQKQGEWMELTAHQGEPASKIAVGTDYVWCSERENIDDRYSNFSTYVQEGTLTTWWRAVPAAE